MAVDIKIKDVWQKVEFSAFTGVLTIPGYYIITIVDGIITDVTDDSSPAV